MRRTSIGSSGSAGGRSLASVLSHRSCDPGRESSVSLASHHDNDNDNIDERSRRSAYSFESGSVRTLTSRGKCAPSSSRGSSRRNRSRSSGRQTRTRVGVDDEDTTTTSGNRRVLLQNQSSPGQIPAAAAAPLEPSLCVMSVVEEGSNISFCCYNEDRNEITTETCAAVTGYETESLVERFLQATRPNMVLVGNRIVNNIPLLEMVTRQPQPLLETEHEQQGHHHRQEGGNPSPRSSIPYRLLKSGIFDVRACRSIILQKLQVLSMLKQRAMDEARLSATAAAMGRSDSRYRNHPDNDRHFPRDGSSTQTLYRPSSYHYLAAVIDFDSKVLVQALGALLSYLQKTVFQLEEGNTITVNRIIEAGISSYLILSPSTFSALNIFSTERHPLIAKGHGHSKEGFSLYSLLDRTKSRGGKQLLREWMLKPLTNLENIQTRQDAIELFLQPSMQASVGVLIGLLQKVGPVDKILMRIQKCTVKPTDFLVLTTTLSAAISIGNVLRNDLLASMNHTTAPPQQGPNSFSCDHQYSFFSELCIECNVEVMIDLRERITNTIDSELTLEEKGASVVIRHGFHEQLDGWKEQYECLEETLAEAAKDLYHKYGQQLDGLTVIFIPQVGYLVGLNETLVLRTLKDPTSPLPPDFEQIFVQDGEVFFKCDEMRRMDEEIGDLDGLIKDTEQMIVTELEENILDTENELRECFRALSTLDCLLSFADCAADLGFTRPQLIDDDEDLQPRGHQQQHHPQRKQLIYIRDGRHPLQEIICDTDFVSNDVQIDDSKQILCVTGPNYSGKSCYMRQVGLLVYMAHLGSFIPCTRAMISITDQIFARVSTIETCSRPQSSYQLELTEMAAVLLKATPKSLVLVDEFGKGTNPASGIAILGAALKRLSTIRCKTVCVTHFLEMFTMNVIEDGEEGIQASRMTIHLKEGEEDGASPLFKLEKGVASSSAGLVCAKNAGVSHAVIDRAKEIIQTMRARKFIRPLPEATKQILKLVGVEREMLAHFLSVDSWENASDDSIMGLLQLLAKVSTQE
ncbi:unnamed protein product [Pseudo-nitzschia multistriata]|uniref:DNA mismatch repair proteins mutS family domain-containing protein n=1 Tax=Pseudo-nitzschia multistriata TaxID=183589 RepID=A0A448Z0L6_9STRA|nr:unnamed protein product [Pseudo-nitzschia multistriata]